METPNALRLADELENGDDVFDMPWQDAADELRRLYAENEELKRRLSNAPISS